MLKNLPSQANLLAKLRATDPEALAGGAEGNAALAADWARSGVRFIASSSEFTAQYWRAVRELFSCIKPTAGAQPILNEGGIYHGCWLESTGTISAELLSRFLPEVAEATFLAFATHQRDDGLFPYKLTADGPVFSQIQLVSPLARSVFTHYRLNGGSREFLEKLYPAMARYDQWLAKYRDTRQTGGVEAFCTYDTGHDLSARFWHVPDSPLDNDPARYNPDNPLLPFIAPDLTANVACQRSYLALSPRNWERTAAYCGRRPRPAKKHCSNSASMPRTASFTIATGMIGWCGYNPTCCCGCWHVRSAMTISLSKRSRATCSTPASSSRNIRSRRWRSMIRATIRPLITTAGQGHRIF
jgi:hypothetical protein